ncbi:MAG: DUF3108 domain-containing protein [Deltaproteobacteria bacterium]
MAKRLLAVLLVLAFLLVAALEIAGRVFKRRLEEARRSVPPPAECPVRPARPSYVGERIEYEVKMGALKIGSAVFTREEPATINGKEQDVFVFETRVVRFTDTERIYADPETLLPLRVDRDISMWPRKERIVERYDQKNLQVTISKNGQTQEIKSDDHLNNAVLLPFSIRENPDLRAGWKIRVNLPTQKFEVTLVGTERVRVPGGEFDTYHFTSQPEKFEVWMTKDTAKIPVKIKGTSGLGYTMFMSAYRPPVKEKQ